MVVAGTVSFAGINHAELTKRKKSSGRRTLDTGFVELNRRNTVDARWPPISASWIGWVWPQSY